MSITTKTIYIPHTSRRKYGDYPTSGTTVATKSGSGGGGDSTLVGTTAYMDA